MAKEGVISDIVTQAPDGWCEYFSTTHKLWMSAKILATDDKTGAIQIDKKPETWISREEQKNKIRVTKFSFDKAVRASLGSPVHMSTMSPSSLTSCNTAIDPTNLAALTQSAPQTHWSPRSAGYQTNEVVSSQVDSSTNGSPKAQYPISETIAINDSGQPTIFRSINEANGVARTIVVNENGSQTVFGEHTVTQLSDSNGEEINSWMQNLSLMQLRGLVHEVGQRLLEGSRLYHARAKQLEEMNENVYYSFFGLTVDATDDELEKAYRKLAKQLHPDKNGGTEDAKNKFQQMKERYEAIRKQRRDEADDSDDSGEDEDDGGLKKLKDARGNKNKEKDKRSSANDDEIAYDPKNRDSLNKTLTKMLQQLKNVEIQMQIVLKELKAVRSKVSEF